MEQARRSRGLFAAVAVTAFAGVALFLASLGSASEVEDLAKIATRDSFGTAEKPLSAGGKWSALSWDNGSSGNNTGAVSAGTGWGPVDSYPTINGAYWNSETYGTKGFGNAVEVTLGAGPGAASRYFALWLNMSSPSSVKTGYQLTWTWNEPGGEGTGAFDVVISKWVSGTQTVLASKSAVSIANGTRIAFSANKGAIKAWTKPEAGSEFKELLSASDATYTSGYAGIEGSGSATRLKLFGAGDFANPEVPACEAPDRYFAGSCWDSGSSEASVSAPAAAAGCAKKDGVLPSALMLAAFAVEPGIALAPSGEWADDVPAISGTNVYAVTTVNSSGEVGSAASSATRKYRCVYPAS